MFVPRPPSPGTTVVITADTASAALETGVGEAKGRVLGVAVSSSFNIAFSHIAGTDPDDPDEANYSFEAGVHYFLLQKQNDTFKIAASATGGVTYWQASFE